MTERRDVPFRFGPPAAGVLGAMLAWAQVSAALGAGTVVPFLMAQAGSVRNLSLVDTASTSIAAAAVLGLAIGVATGMFAASVRVPVSAAVAGTAVVGTLLAVSATAITVDPPVLGALELDLPYGARVDAVLGSALLVGPVIAALVCLLVRTESAAALIVGGLLTVGGVVAAIVATVIVGPAPSGDHRDIGLAVLGPLLLGGLLAYVQLAVVAHRRRWRSREAAAVAAAADSAG